MRHVGSGASEQICSGERCQPGSYARAQTPRHDAINASPNPLSDNGGQVPSLGSNNVAPNLQTRKFNNWRQKYVPPTRPIRVALLYVFTM